jgi:hypothetical protein
MKSETPNKSGRNPKKKGRNPNSLANLKPPFTANNTMAVGHGRPRIPEEERAIKESNYQILNGMVKAGSYEKTMMEVIKKQTIKGQFDAIKWIYENAIGSTIPDNNSQLEKIAPKFEGMTLSELEKECDRRGLPRPYIDSIK